MTPTTIFYLYIGMALGHAATLLFGNTIQNAVHNFFWQSTVFAAIAVVWWMVSL